jgi:hypothetical protein
MGLHSAVKGPVNGHPARTVMLAPPLPVAARTTGPLSAWPRDDGPPAAPPSPQPPATPPPAPAVTAPPRLQWPSWRLPDGDALIRWSSSLAVLAVSAIAAVISYSHIYALALATREFGTDARLLPLSVDGLILASSLTLLHAARRDLTAPVMAYLMLALGVGATVAANVEFGLPYGWKASCVAAWPAVAFIGSVEVALRMTRSRARRPRDRRHWWPRRQGKAVMTVAAGGDGPAMTAPRRAVMAPSPEPLGSLVKAPAPPPAVAAAAPPAARAPRGKAPSRPAPRTAAAPPADGRIAAAIKGTPSLATATSRALADAAGVSVTTVERWRRRQRDDASAG